MRKLIYTLISLLILSLLIFSNASAQLVSGNVFLKGNYVEVGIAPNQQYGTNVAAPSSYHPRGWGLYPFNALGFVADPGMDGWTVGTPDYIGCYFLPGVPQEGWDLSINGTWFRSYANYSPYGEDRAILPSSGTYTFTGSNTDYWTEGPEIYAKWEGNVNDLEITTITHLDTSSRFFTGEVKLKNTGTVTYNDIYYSRTLDPDNESSVSGGGGPTTTNIIHYQPDPSTGEVRALVSATGLSFPSLSYLGIGAIDCRANVYIYTDGLYPSSGPNTLRSFSATHTEVGYTNVLDCAVGIIFNIGDLTPGDSTTFQYIYVLRLEDLDTAFETVATGWKIDDISYYTEADTFEYVSCESSDSLNVEITGGYGYSWGAWEASSGTSYPAGRENKIEMPEETTVYRIIGSTSICPIMDTIFLKIIPADADTIMTTAAICSGGSYNFEGDILTAAGTYYKVISMPTTGCDIVNKLTLSINSPDSDTTHVSICSGGSYGFYGSTYSSPGFYPYLSTSGACDSIHVLALTINDTIRKNGTTSICTGGSITIEGTTITAAGDYTFHYTSAIGCDSLFTWTVTVDPIENDTNSVSICEGESYDFYGTLYEVEGFYTYLNTEGDCDFIDVLKLKVEPNYEQEQTYTFCRNDLPTNVLGITIPVTAESSADYANVPFVSSKGCDSVITINLTILDTGFHYLDTIVCYNAQFGWEENMISEPGVYTHAYTNIAGCDSTVFLEVTFTPDPILYDTIISGCEFVDYLGTRYLENEVIKDTFYNALGCDSVFKQTFITILPTPYDTVYAEICTGESFEFNGKIYQSSTVVTETYIHDNGCDSFSTLVLNVRPKPSIRLEYISTEESLCVLDSVILIGKGGESYEYFGINKKYLGNGDELKVILPHTHNQFYVYGVDEFGCTDTFGLIVMALPCCELAIPNAFSPNADGINDFFGVKTDGHPEQYQLEIFNRWGERVFTSFKVEDQWDGTYENGKPAEIGTYFYRVQGRCYDGTEFNKKGDITLLR